jgi:hypothetical protein
VKKTFTSEEVDTIENQSYETGLAVGKHAERHRILNILMSMERPGLTTLLGALVWTKELAKKIEKLD